MSEGPAQENAVERDRSAARRRRELFVVALAIVAAVGMVFLARQGGELAGGLAGERFVVDYETGLDLTAEDRRVAVDDLALDVRLSPRPVRALETVRFALRVVDRASGDAVRVSSPEVAFNMDMDMGRLVYDLLPKGDTLLADVTIPVCTWGGTRWYARVRFDHDGRRYEKVLLFEVPLGSR